MSTKSSTTITVYAGLFPSRCVAGSRAVATYGPHEGERWTGAVNPGQRARAISQDDSDDRVTIAANGDNHQRARADHSPQVIAEMRKQARPAKFPDTEAVVGYDVATASRLCPRQSR
jgi:hypothetical protein